MSNTRRDGTGWILHRNLRGKIPHPELILCFKPQGSRESNLSPGIFSVFLRKMNILNFFIVIYEGNAVIYGVWGASEPETSYFTWFGFPNAFFFIFYDVYTALMERGYAGPENARKYTFSHTFS